MVSQNYFNCIVVMNKFMHVVELVVIQLCLVKGAAFMQFLSLCSPF